MAEQPNPLTLDLSSVLSGQSFPKDQVTVYLNPDLAYRISKLTASLGDKSLSESEESGVQDEIERLKSEGHENSLTVHVRGISPGSRQRIAEAVLEEFPVKKDVFGREQPNPESDRTFSNRLWAAHIEKIVHPSGGEKTDVTEEDAENIRDNAPDSASEAITKAIMSLSSGEKSGFEALTQEHDFLSQP